LARDVSARFASEGTEVIASSPAQFTDVIGKELILWSKVVKQMGLQAN